MEQVEVTVRLTLAEIDVIQRLIDQRLVPDRTVGEFVSNAIVQFYAHCGGFDGN